MREIVKTMFREIEFGSNIFDKMFSCRDRLKREGYNQYKYYLWGSNIFNKRADGKIEFSFCGYQTSTTKNRISDFLWHEINYHCTLRQKNYQMYLIIGDSKIKIDSDKRYEINPKTREVKII